MNILNLEQFISKTVVINEKRDTFIFWRNTKDLKTRLIAMLNTFCNDKDTYLGITKFGHKITKCISFSNDAVELTKYPMFKDVTVSLVAYSSSNKKLELELLGNDWQKTTIVKFDELEPDAQKAVYDSTVRQIKETLSEVLVFSDELNNID